MNNYLAFFGVVVALAACDLPSKTDGSDGTTAATSEAKSETGEATKPAAANAVQKLDKIGLTASVPSGAVIEDAVIGKGVAIMGSAPVNIAEVAAGDPKTIEAAKAEAAVFNPTNIKEEKLDDGWVLSFENTGSLGTNYWLQSVRTIGDKQFKCDTSVLSDEQLNAARAVCKSLKKS